MSVSIMVLGTISKKKIYSKEMRMDMKRKTKKRILLYVIAAILVVCGIFAYQTNKRSAEKKAQKEAMKNQIKTN